MIILISFSVVTAGVGQSIIFLCIIGAFLHELGHLIFIYKFHGMPDEIVIELFEVKICSDMRLTSKWKDVIITSAGIITNILVAAIVAIIYFFYPSQIIFDFISCNLCIAFVNLLPVQSFDGGQLLYLILLGFTGEKIAYIVVFVLTLLLMFPIFMVGVFVLFTSQHNYSILFIFLYLLSVFISNELR